MVAKGGFVSIQLVGDQEVAAEFNRMAKAVAPELRKSTATYGHLMVTRIRQNASGRPGPNVITGDYRRSWQVIIRGSGQTATAEVYSDSPFWQRLEYGFHGVDSLGRHYDQGPFPHVGPAVDYIVPLWVSDLERIVNRL